MKGSFALSSCLFWGRILIAASIAEASIWSVPQARAAEPGGSKLKYEEPRSLTGAIYDKDRKQVLFNFKRVATRSGSTLKVQRDYTYPDGKAAVRESVVYDGDALVSYALDDLQIGASGSAKIRREASKGTIEFEYRKNAGSSAKAHTETLRENTLIGDMVGPFLMSHWDALQRGEKVKCRYVVVPRVETVGFTFSKDSKAAAEENTVVVKMEPSSALIGALVSPLYFTMSATPPHQVLHYAGRTTPKIKVGSNWKDLDAVTVFDWNSSQ